VHLRQDEELVSDIYCTTFCNFAHDLKTGRPVGHECYILPPKDLRREMDAKDGDDLTSLYTKKGPIVRGRARKEP
jgi:hypothetical protein